MLFFALTSSTWDGLSDGVALLIIAVLLSFCYDSSLFGFGL